MLRAVELSRQGMRAGAGGPYGAVVVLAGRVIGEGFNRVLADRDPTAHAEVVAIRAACRAVDSYWREGCELYSSCRPCPMCLGAIQWARIPLVYYANTAEDAERIGHDDARFLADQARSDGPRLVHLVHVEAPEAAEVFAEWLAFPDRPRY